MAPAPSDKSSSSSSSWFSPLILISFLFILIIFSFLLLIIVLLLLFTNGPSGVFQSSLSTSTSTGLGQGLYSFLFLLVPFFLVLALLFILLLITLVGVFIYYRSADLQFSPAKSTSTSTSTSTSVSGSLNLKSKESNTLLSRSTSNNNNDNNNNVPSGNNSKGRRHVPIAVLTDSYKASHYLMYPESKLMVAYGEFRGGFDKDKKDERFIFYGIRYIIENFVAIQWTEDDVNIAENFYKTHNVAFTNYPFPKDLFLKFVRENDGYFPVRIEALEEGTVAHIHTPVYQIFAENEYSRLVTFLETILTQVWYPSTVATLSRRTKDLIENAFNKSVDEEAFFLLDSRLHDFGFRGCTCVEQSILGGMAHLLNFSGSDTMSACYYAQYELNDGKPIATSIPATEHSVMTSWPNEKLAIKNMIDKFGGDGKVFACVMDSYDYSNALNVVVPSVSKDLTEKGGLMVLRPDSGDPVECVMMALKAGEKTFGYTVNKKGFKVLKSVNVIQGDGINYDTVNQILEAALAEKYSAQNIAFGMGGGLLQKVNRDTMQFATKLSYIVYADGTSRDVMKRPKTDSAKFSLPGITKVIRQADGNLAVFPRYVDDKPDPKNQLKCVYDFGPVKNHTWDSFETVRNRVGAQWSKAPPKYDVVTQPLKDRIKAWVKNFDENYEKMIKA